VNLLINAAATAADGSTATASLVVTVNDTLAATLGNALVVPGQKKAQAQPDPNAQLRERMHQLNPWLRSQGRWGTS
jgi:hypothetical protein